MSNADLIADVRHDYTADRDPAVLALADALEAAEAYPLARFSIAELKTALRQRGHIVHYVFDDDCPAEVPPAELLEAVAAWDDILWGEYGEFLSESGQKARATLVKYGLLRESTT